MDKIEDSKGMTRIHDVEYGNVSEEDRANLHNFFMELVDLCNKYRICFAIDKIFCIPKTSYLEVAGFYYDSVNKVTLPAYKDKRGEDAISSSPTSD